MVATVAIALAVTIPLLYLYASSGRALPWEFQPFVSYSYTVAVSSNASTGFTVFCPFLANNDDSFLTRAAQSLRITGNATTANVTTEHGEALKITGTGLVVITWYSKSELPGPWDGYKDYHHLTLLEGSGYGSTAHVFSQRMDVLFDLVFHYEHVYGNVGANFLTYEIVGGLESGWNILPVDFSSAVA